MREPKRKKDIFLFKLFRKIKSYSWIMWSLPQTIIFNFHYLPIYQAIKLPILLRKPTFGPLEGRIVIKSSKIYFGMIQLGVPLNLMYRNDGIFFEISNNGKLIFEGPTQIGNASSISIGPKGTAIIGAKVFPRVAFKLIAYHYVKIGANTHIGWNVLIMDCGMHMLKNSITHEKIGKPFGPIIIGESNWIGTNSSFLKGAKTSPNTIIASGSVVTKDFSNYTDCIIGGNPLRVLKNSVYRDFDDDGVEYDYYKES